MKTLLVDVKVPEECNAILGQSHFIKTVEDLYEALVNAVPNIKFGVAFCEASGPCLVRVDGNDNDLQQLASKTASAISAGHTFVIFMRNAYPINVLDKVKAVPEVCNIFLATANPFQVILAQTEQGRGVLGVIDGYSPKGIESEKDMQDRRILLRKIGYKQS
ncbi:MAG TPA: adenosine-specific kinase [Candidatus Bathyarchaeia archaeon]|jgi:adenosine/AMP kinase|nr:adenosine-specific kinase [Candidatus Bathyarchaeia archaeon]